MLIGARERFAIRRLVFAISLDLCFCIAHATSRQPVLLAPGVAYAGYTRHVVTAGAYMYVCVCVLNE